MAIIVFDCPFCNMKVETPWFSALPAEYQEASTLTGVGVLALALVGLIVASAAQWARGRVDAAPFIADQRALILLGSAVSLAFLLVSAVTRKSLIPAVLAAGAWGMFALIWVGGIGHVLGKLAATEGATPVKLAKMAKLAMFAALIAVGAALYVYYQCKDGEALHNFGFFLLATQVVACFAALIVVTRYVKPGLAGPAPRPASQMAPREAPDEPPPDANG